MVYKEQLQDYLKSIYLKKGSDLHLIEKEKPTIRVEKQLITLLQEAELTEEDMNGFLDAVLTDSQKETFQKEKSVLFGYEIEEDNVQVRVRGTAYVARSRKALALRIIPPIQKTIDQLNLPKILSSVARAKQGLFLVVGPTGQGKSTALAALIEYINKNYPRHIVTVEDPIEFLFTSDRSIINQQEVGADVDNFSKSFEIFLRMDADAIMIGEMRDTKAFEAAMSAAETGHLVLSTLHTNSAAGTVSRIVDSFPSIQQNQVRSQLADSLLGVISLRLVKSTDGSLIPAYEIMFNNKAIAHLIRENSIQGISTVIETSQEEGMVTLDQTLARLVREGKISIETARENSNDINVLNNLI